MCKRVSKVVLLSLLCGPGLALATARVVLAPTRDLEREVQGAVPSDRYLDLGAQWSEPAAGVYSRARHTWQTERGREVPLDETRYVDVARQRP